MNDTEKRELALLKLAAGPDRILMDQQDLAALRDFIQDDAGSPSVMITVRQKCRKVLRKLGLDNIAKKLYHRWRSGEGLRYGNKGAK